MWRTIKNFFSYLGFVLSLDYAQILSTLIDIGIFIWTLFNWEEVFSQKSLTLAVLAVFANFVWQIYNVAGHFRFLKKENPKDPLKSLLKKSEDSKKDFRKIKVEDALFIQAFSYQADAKMGVLESEAIVSMLRDAGVKMIPMMGESKRKETRTYVKQYQDTLLKFLNHRWYEIQMRHGEFVNDRKVCFASEPFLDGDGICRWRITGGRYYNGYLTNFIYTKYVGGSYYKLYPPVNMNTDPIKALGSSDFSDHIGVSTLLLTLDGYVFFFRQAGNAGYNADCYMPTGSGSMDYKDYKKGDDLRAMVIRTAERELAEESSIKKRMGKKAFAEHVRTSVIGYYRDMERGGKPEFCCVSRIDKNAGEVVEYIEANKKELADLSRVSHLLDNEKQWEKEIYPEASLSLKMNYKFLLEVV